MATTTDSGIDGSTARTAAPSPPLTSLDERSDSLSTLSSSLSLLLQIASTSLHRLSSSQHIQLHPDIPPHTHLHASGIGASSSGSDGLIPPKQMREDVKEMVEDFMERVKWMKEEIARLPVEKTEEEHEAILKQLDGELKEVNEEYLEAMVEAEALQKELDSLLLQSCS